MPKKKKVTKASAKESIKRLHNAAKRKERPKMQAVEPVAVREIPPQSERKVVEVEAAHIEVKEPPVEEKAEIKEEPVEEEEPEQKHEPEAKEHAHKIVIGDAIEFGWTAVKSHIGFFIGIFLLFAALSFMNYSAHAIGTRIVLSLFVCGISLGYIKVATDLVDEKKLEFKELFSCFSLLPQYILTGIVYTIVVVFGLVLLIIPGVIWAVQFGFYPFVIVRDRSWPLKALRKSSSLTQGAKGKLIVFAFALLGINLLGLIALGIGIIVTIPLSVIATAHVFKQLENA